MQHNHLIEEHTAFSLTAIDNHRLLVDHSTVVLTSTCRVARRLTLGHASLIGIKLNQLIRALTHLALLMEHETATECVNLAVIGNGCVALSALDDLGACVRDPLPNYLVAVDLSEHDFLAYVVVEPTHEVHVVTYGCQGRTLTRRRLTLRVNRNLDIDTETFSLLHALDVGLKAPDQLVDELVLGDIVCRIDHELLVLFFIARLRVLYDEARAGSVVLDPLRD